ncbi:long-chain fatty acid--CoA ligase [Bacillus sp. V5-8f]|uniref:long-chain-fatty-acid--CoA ligase n=1 Tax=Bacillus sp. V5-8f TaxID=2053044 RepID=UPI000C77F6B8|nr:long-chain fatty acid--CoA ligase [Bacillus sp. V5-8f]PLT35105.1 long-chain fatty acid--CoA ligase [Bacillus sp. V5-8f]
MDRTEKPWLKYYHPKLNEFATVENISLFKMFKNAVECYSNDTALTFYDKKFTYEEVAGIVEKFAASLHNLGFKKGDRLSIMLPNSPHYIFSLFAAFRLGGIGVQVNPMYVEREIEHVLKDSGSEFIVVFEALYPRVKKVQGSSSLKHIIVVGFEQNKIDLADGDFYFDSLLAREVENAPKVDIVPEEDVAVLQYTGGTTGVSKGVMLTHKNLMSNIEQVNDFIFKPIEVPHNAKIMSILPMFHIYGLTCNVFLGIHVGCNQIILPRFDVQEVMETVKREQPFQFSAVPTMYIGLNSHPRLEEYGFDKVAFFNSGGAAMPIEQLHLFEKRTGCKLNEGFGLSEASPVTHNNPTFLERRVGSIGLPLPSLEAKIVRETDEGFTEVPVGEAGELIVKGPQVMKGYWQRPEDTAEAIKDGWLYTGDIARMDEDGYFYIVDRKKDMIIASGYNVYPREIEEVLYQHEAVQEVIVVGVPDEYRGETVKAFVTLKAGAAVTEEELILYAKQFLAPYKAPKFVEIRDELPKSSVGKLLRRKLRDEPVVKN